MTQRVRTILIDADARTIEEIWIDAPEDENILDLTADLLGHRDPGFADVLAGRRDVCAICEDAAVPGPYAMAIIDGHAGYNGRTLLIGNPDIDSTCEPVPLTLDEVKAMVTFGEGRDRPAWG